MASRHVWVVLDSQQILTTYLIILKYSLLFLSAVHDAFQYLYIDVLFAFSPLVFHYISSWFFPNESSHLWSHLSSWQLPVVQWAVCWRTVSINVRVFGKNWVVLSGTCLSCLYFIWNCHSVIRCRKFLNFVCFLLGRERYKADWRLVQVFIIEGRKIQANRVNIRL